MASKGPEAEPRIVQADFAASAAVGRQLPPPVTAEVVFAGRSNVGKSSLINSLVDRKNLVRTSSTPGCTRSICFYDVRFADGARLQLVDLPGYGYAKRSKSERDAWAELIESYLLERPTLRAAVLIVDVRRGLEAEERDLLELFASPPRTNRPGVVPIVVATKLDKVPASKQKPTLAALRKAAGVPITAFSAVSGEGKAELLRKIRKAAGLVTD